MCSSDLAYRAGMFTIYYGSSAGLVTTSGTTEVQASQASANLGYAIAFAGDVNGDRFADAVAGAPLYDDGETDEGAVFVYEGDASGLSATATTEIEGDQAGGYLGIGVTGAGDVNGDGYDDVAAVANNYDDGESNEGVFVLSFGSATGASAAWSWYAGSDHANSRCLQVEGVGDTNRDGYDDLLGSCVGHDGTASDIGKAMLWYGGVSGPASTTPDWSVTGDEEDDGLGNRIAALHDIDGDGLADFAVGTVEDDINMTDQGSVSVFLGGTGGISATPDLVFTENFTDDLFGTRMSGSSDVEGDGIPELFVTAAERDIVYVYTFLDSDDDGTMDWLDCAPDDATRAEDCGDGDTGEPAVDRRRRSWARTAARRPGTRWRPAARRRGTR